MIDWGRPRPPLGQRIQARLFRVINVPMRAILSLPFRTPLNRRLMLVTLTSRKTQRTYTQPVSYVQQGQTLLTPGGGKWKLSLQEGQPVRMRLRARWVHATPALVSDPDEMERLLAAMITAYPGLHTFLGIRKSSDGRLDRGRLQTAVQHGFRVVRWQLETSDPSPGDEHSESSAAPRPT